MLDCDNVTFQRDWSGLLRRVLSCAFLNWTWWYKIAIQATYEAEARGTWLLRQSWFPNEVDDLMEPSLKAENQKRAGDVLSGGALA